MILKESNNIFRTDPKDPDSRITQRIATADVDPTIDWLNKTFGFKFVDADKLGSTGKKVKPDGTFEENSSGDIDLNVDIRELPKEEIIAKLSAWCQKQGIPDLEIMNKGQTFRAGWVANAGLQIHFRTPIKGDPKNGYVQTDFMLTDNPDLQRGAKRGGTEKFTGADRAVMLASLARGRGLKFSPTKGLVDPEKGDEVVADNWSEIAVILLGQGAKEEDTHTVEQMLAKIKNLPEYEQLIAGIKDNFEKQGRMFPESARGIHHGIKLAEKQKRTDELVGKALKGVAKVAGKTAMATRDLAKAGYGGYKAGRAAFSPGGSLLDMPGAYAKAGGPKTAIGAVSDKVKQKIVDPLKKVTGYKDDPIAGKSGSAPTDDNEKVTISYKSRNGKVITKEIPFKQFPKFQAKGWSLGTIKESVKLNEGARIDHAEDLIFSDGSIGAVRALESLKNLEKGGHENVTVKWDGSPAVIFGRNENGEFIFTDKSGFVKKGGVERATSGDDLEQMLLNRSGGAKRNDPDRIAFAGNMKDVFKDYEKATPADFRGYFKGDLLYYNTPKIEGDDFVFSPQLVEYRVNKDSELGKKIAKSKTGIVIHRLIDEQGTETQFKDASIFQGNDVLVVPPVYAEKAPQVDNENIIRLAKIIQRDSADIDKLLDPNTLAEQQMKDFGKILYTYTNSKVDTGLDNLGKDFLKWLDTTNLSQRKKAKMTEYIKQNIGAFASLWEVVTGIMKVKDQVIADLDKQEGAVRATVAGKPGGEGYVLAHPEGDIKLVNRREFSAANRAKQR